MDLLLIIVLLLLLTGSLPAWHYHDYGYGPSGLLGILLVVALVVVLMRRRGE